MSMRLESAIRPGGFRGFGVTLSACVASVMLLARADVSAQEPSLFEPALEVARTLPRLYSLLISVDDELVVEEYFNGKGPSSIANVKSVSKSIISALVGIAIGAGHLEGVDQPIGDFFGVGHGRVSNYWSQPLNMVTGGGPETQNRAPILGITGTGGAGKSSLVDELVRRFLSEYPVIGFIV